MEVIAFIGLLHLCIDLGSGADCGPVQGQKLVKAYQICRRQLVNAAKDIAAGVADAAVGVNQAGDNVVRKAHVVAVFHGGSPEAHYVCAVLGNDFLRGNDVAHGLGHLEALAVHHIAVCEHVAVGRHALGRHAEQKRAVEPAAVLVGPFKIEVRRIGELGTLLQDAGPGGPGIEPHIQDVCFLLPVCAAAMRAFQAVRHNLLEIGLEPVVAACGMLGKAGADVLHPGGIVPGLAAVLAEQCQDGHAPLALP